MGLCTDAAEAGQPPPQGKGAEACQTAAFALAQTHRIDLIVLGTAWGLLQEEQNTPFAAAAAAAASPATATPANRQGPVEGLSGGDVGGPRSGVAAGVGYPAETPQCDGRGHREVSAEEVVATRSGDVLLRHTILKSDHFPGCQNMKLTPLIEGAPNFRQVGAALRHALAPAPNMRATNQRAATPVHGPVYKGDHRARVPCTGGGPARVWRCHPDGERAETRAGAAGRGQGAPQRPLAQPARGARHLHQWCEGRPAVQRDAGAADGLCWPWPSWVGAASSLRAPGGV